MIENKNIDFLVVGSGLAGLSYALKVADHGQVLVVSKTKLETGNTEMAQGGIAAVTSPGDTMDKHIQDTTVAGAGLCNDAIVKMVVESAPVRIQELVKWGVRFDRDENDDFELTREGGHSERRILHVEDHTGLDIQRQLLKVARQHKNIQFLEHNLALDLITKRSVDPDFIGPDIVLGARFFDKNTNAVTEIHSQFTVLATGGAGKVYLYTSNWDGATGDGIAIAHRAGARVKNLEFMQFHPTCLYHPHARNFLITEAMRGEGGELINHAGKAFMKGLHPMGSLAPRDIVARGIDAEMKRTGADHVFLDLTHLSAEFIKTRFPQIHSKCLELGIDITKSPIPVVPAAHYLCGGVVTDANGKTDLARLYAVGETACTGLHGANRLASNSLLECLVFSHNAANDCVRQLKTEATNPILPKESVAVQKPINPTAVPNPSDEMALVSYMWEEIRRLMWSYVGIVRTNRRLERAAHRLQNINNEIQEYYSQMQLSADLIELRNIACVADLTVQCARDRKQSIGIHYNLDC
jgi:L-aspartate oxidase